MKDQFKAIVINQVKNNFTREIKNLDKSFFKIGDVLIEVEYSCLNYKDALILNDGGKLVKEYPQIPGIDFSGKVIETQNSNFKVGESVILTGCRVGEIYPGGYSELAKVKSEFLVKTPKKLSNKKAMVLGTAGLTALLCAYAVKAKATLPNTCMSLPTKNPTKKRKCGLLAGYRGGLNYSTELCKYSARKCGLK